MSIPTGAAVSASTAPGGAFVGFLKGVVLQRGGKMLIFFVIYLVILLLRFNVSGCALMKRSCQERECFVFQLELSEDEKVCLCVTR